MAEYTIDPESDAVGEHYAVIQTPRRQRKRFPAGCVRIVAAQEEALASADPKRNEYPARVYGPSASSEGLRIYYLIRWLD